MADAITSEPVRLRSGTFAALENPNYRRFYLGQGISLIGTWLQGAAVSWIVFEKTQSEDWLGVVSAASLLPGLFVGVFAGVLADRVAPRKMVMSMQIGQMILAFTLTAMVGLGIAAVWQMALILAMTRVCVAFEMPSRQVFLRELVGRTALPNAIALNSGLFNASRVLGPALAGICYASLGATACFGLNGLSYVAAITALVTIRSASRSTSRGTGGLGEAFGGFAYLRRDRRVATLFLLMAFFGIVGMGFDAMIPAYARRVVATDVKGYSVLLACSGVGSTFGALLIAWLGGSRRKERLVLAGLCIFAASLATAAELPLWIGRAWPGPARLVAASVCLFGIGLGAVLFYAATQTLIQTAVPDELRGRIMAIWMIVYSGSVPLGSLLTGRIASNLGLTTAIVLSAALCVSVAVFGFVRGTLSPRASSA